MERDGGGVGEGLRYCDFVAKILGREGSKVLNVERIDAIALRLLGTA